MYKKHKCVLFIIFLCVFVLAFCVKIGYEYVASEGITVVSIVLAIYMTSFSGLLSSELAKKMKTTQDFEIKEKSQLGVLRGYLNCAVSVGVLNIVVSCVILVLSETMPDNKGIIYFFISASGYATLAGNLFLMFLLYGFMVNRQLFE